MLGTVIAALFLVQAPSQPDNRYMRMGTYIAGSALKDPEALGGFAVSDNLPREINDKTLLGNGPKATLKVVDGGLTLTLTNGGRQDSWFDAGDSKILAWLEARDVHGDWQPIEYKPWYSCGNSFHRVGLPSGFGWTWRIEMPKGLFTTKVRWRYSIKSLLLSNEVEVGIPPQRFRLSPDQSKTQAVDRENGYPMIREKL